MSEEDDFVISGSSDSSEMEYENYDSQYSYETNSSSPLGVGSVSSDSQNNEDFVAYETSDDSQNLSDNERSPQPTEAVSSESALSESAPSESGPSGLTSTQNNANSEQNTPMMTNENSEVTEKGAFSCPICLEGLTTTGSHRSACLKCGHIFGEYCLERWLKTGCNADARRCPTCNTKASIRDIRIIYATNLIAVDTAEITALENKLELEKINKILLEKQVTLWETKCEFLTKEVNRLTNIVENQSLPPAAVDRECLKKINLSKIAGCRVLAYNEKNMMLLVSQSSESPLFKKQIIRKINTTLMIPQNDNIFVHNKTIRDMSFHPYEDNMLASVGLDKCIKLIDLSSNTEVSSFDVSEPLWSCCWAGNNTNMLIVGSQSGSIYYLDRRFMKLLNSDLQRNLACVSLVSIPPSNSRSFSSGGFLKTKMDLLTMFEHSTLHHSSYKETDLPLRGLWSSTCFDNESNLILSSAKPCGANKSARHIVSKIVDSNESSGSVIHPVVTFYGGDKATQLSRSCLVPSNGSHRDTLVSYFDEKSSSIHLCSVNSSSSVHKFKVQEKILDICNLKGMVVSNRRTIAALSDNSVSIYCV